MPRPVYALGLELSTQSAKSVLLDVRTGEVVRTDKVDFDTAFPAYGTRGGVLPSAVPGERHTSPLMLLEAVDAVFRRLADAGIAMASVRCVKADAMQHCTVYLDASFAKLLKGLSPSRDLKDQLAPSFSRPTSPIWEDRTTEKEVGLLERWFRSSGGLETLCGNRPELRFPAAQIMRWAVLRPEEYERTAHIMLLSAFVTSLLAGRVCPVDTGDGWGTNLNSLDLRRPGWHPRILKSLESWRADQGLRSPLTPKLGAMTHYDADCGRIAPYFVRRYGLPASCRVLAGTGDNPATLLGCGGGAVVSLGSSYTVNGVMDRVVPSASGEYNIFGYTKGRAMALSVVTNGGKVHEAFLRRYLGKSPTETLGPADWERYVELARPQDPLREDEPLLLPYLMDESVPLAKAGVVRDGFGEEDAAANIRALHVSQAVALRLHAGHLAGVREFCVAAGGAKNPFFRQLLADCFGAACWSLRDADVAAPLGCAVSGLRRLRGGGYHLAVARALRKDPATLTAPRPESAKAVSRLLERYRALEERRNR